MITTAIVAQITMNTLKSKDTDLMQTPDISWAALNPARGDKGPRAGNLWNDRTAEAASGFLVKFLDGFSSPPHIHNVTYRGVVIRGEVHNDDPNAAEMWMPPGSFWTQPAGEVHITAAKGKDVTAYIEIDSGPYLVLPKEQAQDNGERPINMVPSNMIWLSPLQTSWIEAPSITNDKELPEIAFLWGKPAEKAMSGSFIRLPKGFRGELSCEGESMRVVIIKGAMTYTEPSDNTVKTLKPSEYFGLSRSQLRRIHCQSEQGCLAYIRADGTYRVKVSVGKG